VVDNPARDPEQRSEAPSGGTMKPGGSGMVRTLRGRLILGSMAGLIVATLLFMAAATSFSRGAASDSAREELDRQAVEIGLLISARLERDAEKGELGSVSTSIPNLQRLVGPDAVVYYTGLPTAVGDSIDSTLPDTADRQVDYGILAEEGLQRIDFTVPGSGHTVEGTAVPIELGGQNWGAVLVARPPKSFSPGLSSAATQLIAAAALGLFIALGLIYLLTSRLLRPLQAMQAATRSVAEGNMRLQLGPTGTQELDELSGSFNRMVERLAERERLNRDFLMKVTHDLRTPLTAIRGHATALSDGVVPAEDQGKSLAAIDGEATRLETMVSDLLDLAKIDAHTFRVELDEVQPAEVLEQTFDAFEAGAAARGVLYQRNIAALPPIVTDATRMQQIASNLIENALRWTEEDGSVRLDARSTVDGGIVVSVRDTGPGIAPEDQEAIFEAFASNETPDGSYGSGLGLAISRQLARTLGGDVTVESRPGHGSSFTLELPAAAPEDAETLDRI
jgi:two-component system OmpR family sensor kinase